ncbi:MAG: preprotein translocase subunit SecE [Mogibacterium sp.]|nr:preprotein translocase subunit SecE [Mogibacterium sp.]
MFEYLKGVRQEMIKVVWPTKEELASSTVVVLITCAFFALAFWVIDSAFLAALKGILGITLS